MRSKSSETFTLIEDFINAFKDENGCTPTVREIEGGTELSISTISRYLAYMRDHGMIEYSGHRNIVTQDEKKLRAEYIKVPILGSVSCGVPKYAKENIEEYVRLPVAIFGHGDFYLLRANGDSMIGADINNGDLVLIRQQNSAESGQIVVALIGDEATLKRYYPEPENHRIRLHPENEEMADVYTDNCIVQGVAVNVIKDIA